MSHYEIDPDALRDALAQVADRFVTKDVSEQTALRSFHGALSAHSHWHAFVGKALRHHSASLGITYVDAGASRGARWSKVNPSRRAEGSAVTRGFLGALTRSAQAPQPRPRSEPLPRPGVDYGPQYGGDDAFTARMRFHQSHYRATVLGVPCGFGPGPSDLSRYGNMLDREAGARGLNYTSPEAFAAAKARVAEGGGAVDPYRLHHNMLSSQPLCFNLFGPLVDAPERAGRLLRALSPDVARVEGVKIEWAPSPASAFLADRTAFDAVVEYERPDGTMAILAFETKLTDTFSQKVYDREEYRRWMRGPGSPFTDRAWAEVATARYNQLWRNHLLALAVRDHHGSPIAAARSVVVHHPGDASGAGVVAGYRGLLKPDDDTFDAWPLDRVVSAFESVATDDERPWLTALRSRYLDLAASEDAWRAARSQR